MPQKLPLIFRTKARLLSGLLLTSGHSSSTLCSCYSEFTLFMLSAPKISHQLSHWLLRSSHAAFNSTHLCPLPHRLAASHMSFRLWLKHHSDRDLSNHLTRLCPVQCVCTSPSQMFQVNGMFCKGHRFICLVNPCIPSINAGHSTQQAVRKYLHLNEKMKEGRIQDTRYCSINISRLSTWRSRVCNKNTAIWLWSMTSRFLEYTGQHNF